MDSSSLKLVGKVAAGAVVAVGGATLALPFVGFGTAGVVASSTAAIVQSWIGCVSAGSAFASLQSAGVLGFAAGTKVALAAAGGGAAAKLL